MSLRPSLTARIDRLENVAIAIAAALDGAEPLSPLYRATLAAIRAELAATTITRPGRAARPQ